MVGLGQGRQEKTAGRQEKTRVGVLPMGSLGPLVCQWRNDIISPPSLPTWYPLLGILSGGPKQDHLSL